MATIKVTVRKDQPKKDGSLTICIRVYSKEKVKNIFIGHSVLLKFWDDKNGKVKTSHPDAHIINAIIEDKRSSIMKEITDTELAGKTVHIKRIGKTKQIGSFSEYIKRRKEYFNSLGNDDMVYKINNDVRELETVFGGEVYFNDITVDMIHKLESFWLSKGNSRNTIARKIKNLRSHYKGALKESIAPYPNPFELVKMKKEPVKREKLNEDQIKKLEALDLPAGSITAIALDMFLFAFYCQGMRFGNVIRLKKEAIDNDAIIYQMSKGMHHRKIGIHKKLQSIIEKYLHDDRKVYLFPLLEDREYTDREFQKKKGSVNAIINSQLKYIASMIGININLSTHISKHSFASIAKSKEVSPHVIKDALGHTSYAVTEAYLKSLDESEIDKGVKKVFE